MKIAENSTVTFGLLITAIVMLGGAAFKFGEMSKSMDTTLTAFSKLADKQEKQEIAIAENKTQIALLTQKTNKLAP